MSHFGQNRSQGMRGVSALCGGVLLALYGMPAHANYTVGQTYTFPISMACQYKTAEPTDQTACYFAFSDRETGRIYLSLPYGGFIPGGLKYRYGDYKNAPGVTAYNVASQFAGHYATRYAWDANYRLTEARPWYRQVDCPVNYVGAAYHNYTQLTWESLNDPGLKDLFVHPSLLPPSEQHIDYDYSRCERPNKVPSIPVSGSLTIDEDTQGTYKVVITDPDTADTHTIEYTQRPANGTLSAARSGRDIVLTYKPNKDWYGTDIVKARVKDNRGGMSGVLTLSITVNPVNDAPTAVGVKGGYIALESGEASPWYDIVVTDVDLPNDTHNIEITGDTQGGTVEVNGSKVRFVSGPDQHGKVTLSMIATDSEGLSVTSSLDVHVRKLAPGGTATLPAVQGALYGKNGNHGIVTPEFGRAISAYRVSVTADSAEGIILGNQQINPGESISLPAGTYQKSNSALSLPIGAIRNRDGYTATVEIKPDDIFQPSQSYKVVFESLQTELSGLKPQFTQLFDTLDLKVKHTKSAACTLTTQQAAAMDHDPVRQPVCLVEWTAVPDELIAGPSVASPALTGRAVTVGTQRVGYNLYMYTGEGKRTLLQSFAQDIEVESAFGKVVLGPTKPTQAILHNVEALSFGLTSQDGLKCSPAPTERVTLGSTVHCNVEWTALPQGFRPIAGRELPEVAGYAELNEKAVFGWKAYAVTPKGTRIELSEQSYTVDVVPPHGPTMEIDTAYRYGDFLAIPLDKKRDIAIAAMDAHGPADLVFETSRSSDAPTRIEYPANTGNNTARARIDANHDGAVYSKHSMEVSAFYLNMPELKTTQTLNYTFVPASGVQPYFRLDVDKVLSTESLPVTVTMTDRKNNENTYKPEYGVWDVQVFEVIRKMGEETRYVPVSERLRINEMGQASFMLDLGDVSATNTRLVAKAELVHDVEGYARETESKQMYVSVLYGGEVAGEIFSKRVSGPAPFSAYLQFKPDTEDAKAARALGNTVWEVSSDGGQTWERSETGSRPHFTRTFEKGTYLIRATAENKNSGVPFSSEVVEIVAYNNPTLVIEGGEEAFVGDLATVSVTPLMDDAPVAVSDVTIQWSVDKGETFEDGTHEHIAQKDSPGAYQLMVRVKEAAAPVDDRYAWTVYKVNPRFHAVTGPKVAFNGPRKMEFGKTYTFTANAAPRAKGLLNPIASHFILPNGITVEGESITYSPTREDVEQGKVNITYKAWFPGFEEQGGVTERALNMRVWEYVWPEFTLETQGTIRHAPTKAILNLKNTTIPTPLEDATYEWVLPEGVTVTRNRGNRLEIEIAEGGTLVFEVTVRDERDNATTASLTLDLDAAPEWVVEREVKYSNEQMREPLTVSYRPSFSGGHPKDRISKKEFYLNGEPLRSGGIAAKVELPAGTHTLSVVMESRYGDIVTDAFDVEVIGNAIPTCTVKVIDNNGRWKVEPDCQDQDGVVRRIFWTIDGVETSGSKYKTFIQSRVTEPTVIEIRAMDDAGGLSEPVAVTLNPKGESSKE